uniref:VWFA domain-containing protein n=1 Tax=Paramormyrops kingsleyae TaxID=1676925 RepID=A0A3B3RH22_9TELE
MKDFVSEFIKMFKIGPDQVRIGLVKYADNPTTEFELTRYTDKQELQTAVQQVHQVGGGTETGKALFSMSALFQKAAETRGEKVPQILITITDGKSTDSVIGPAQGLKTQGITSYAIGIKDADEKQLSEIEVIADIMFLIDSSGSIDPEDYNKMKAFMVSIVNKSDIGQDKVNLGVVQYSDRPELIFDQKTFYDKASITTAINQMTQLGSGTLTGAFSKIYFGKEHGGRRDEGVPQILMVITDGRATDAVALPVASRGVLDAGINVYAIGVAGSPNSSITKENFSRFSKSISILKA